MGTGSDEAKALTINALLSAVCLVLFSPSGPLLGSARRRGDAGSPHRGHHWLAGYPWGLHRYRKHLPAAGEVPAAEEGLLRWPPTIPYWPSTLYLEWLRPIYYHNVCMHLSFYIWSCWWWWWCPPATMIRAQPSWWFIDFANAFIRTFNSLWDHNDSDLFDLKTTSKSTWMHRQVAGGALQSMHFGLYLLQSERHCNN